ncbi:putative uncharacterized protein [Clostridium sp. CAG:571]|jgi:hypothetical protein|nr:putative uncharacterized protein [Clostridium sp. CAG:571]
MNKKRKILIIFGILIILFIIVFVVINKANIFSKKVTKLQSVEGITVVPTMNDTITADSSWCGTFQLVWNDMKNEVVKKDVIFNPQLDMVKNLNKEDFNETMLSEDYYYKIYGLKSLALKEQLENGLKEKFNQTSDILNDFNWSESELDNPNNPNVRRYFFYTMLYRKFEFLQEFDKLDNGKFGNKYKDVQYFGIDENTENSVGNQITVLYYNSKDDFAIIVNTKTDDEVIFCKSPNGSNFNEIYENMNNESNKYTGSRSFKNVDEFKAPNLEFDEKKEYTELANKEFKTADPYYDTAEIQKAIQTIKFSLDEKGGEIKSEAAIDMTASVTSVVSKPKADEPRYFYVDDTFAIFLREKGKTKPYFAGRIDDITKFQ